MQPAYNVEAPTEQDLATVRAPVRVSGWFADARGRPARDVRVRTVAAVVHGRPVERPDVVGHFRERWPKMPGEVGFEAEVKGADGLCRLVIEAETEEGIVIEIGQKLLRLRNDPLRAEGALECEPGKTAEHKRAGARMEEKGDGDAPQVLVISHDAALAGAQMVLLSLLAEWNRRAPFPIRVICGGDGVLRAQFESLFPTLVLSDFRTKEAREEALKGFTRGPIRLIYSNTVVNGPLLEGLKRLGAPVITHCHEMQQAIERWAPGEIMEATIRNSDFFVGASRGIVANLHERHHVPMSRMEVVYASIDLWDDARVPAASELAEMRRELGLKETDVVVFGCGTTDWRKGPDLFMAAALRACAANPSLKFVWIGGALRYGDEEICAKGFAGRVQFIGTRLDARRYFYAGHIFALSSREDPCPLVALEAADAGLPVVCFDRAGDMPAILGNECGAVVPYENSDEMAEAIGIIARNPVLRGALGRAAGQRVRLRHSSKASALAMEAVFERVLLESQRAGRHTAGPLVSVIVPNYNHEKHLPERLRTVAGQTLRDIEIILLDDASTDGSVAVLKDFAATDRRARLLVNERNSGSTFKQWRKGIREAGGKYVWIAESDDMADPALLETLVARLEADPSIALAYCQLRMMDAGGTIGSTPDEWLGELDPRRWNEDFVADGMDEIRRYLSKKTTILNASGVVIRNFSGLEELVTESMRLCGDWLLWIRLCARGKVAYVAKPLNFWRLNTSNARTRPPGDLEWSEGQEILAEVAELLRLDDSSRQAIIREFKARCDGWLAQS